MDDSKTKLEAETGIGEGLGGDNEGTLWWGSALSTSRKCWHATVAQQSITGTHRDSRNPLCSCDSVISDCLLQPTTSPANDGKLPTLTLIFFLLLLWFLIRDTVRTLHCEECERQLSGSPCRQKERHSLIKKIKKKNITLKH